MQIFSVSEFIAVLNDIMRRSVSPHEVGVLGEVAEYRVSQNKWLWFKLKDEESVLDCFATVWQIREPLEDGMQIKVYGYPKVHPKSGKFSLNVERVEFVGEGALRRAFELLKQKLEKEGLFAPERKRPLPRFPEEIGLIASRESAAYTDFLRIAENRWAGLKIHLAHVSVQGVSSVSEIVSAFKLLEQNHRLQAIVLIRGGGSLEDLQAFNSEDVARAVFGAKVPVVVGVGHERDETIADYVADRRASTPSNAAELLLPERREVIHSIFWNCERIKDRLERALELKKDGMLGAAGILARFAERRHEIILERVSRISEILERKILESERSLAFRTRVVESLNPSRLLARGYSIVFKDGNVVKSSANLFKDDEVQVRLSKGQFKSRVIDL